MARKKRKHTVEVTDNVAKAIAKSNSRRTGMHTEKTDFRFNISNSNYRVDTPLDKYRRINRVNKHTKITVRSKKPITQFKAEKMLINSSLDDTSGLLLVKKVRERTKCEQRKAARRAKAFYSGSAGLGKRTTPRRKHKCL